jgi:hypothetical protein
MKEAWNNSFARSLCGIGVHAALLEQSRKFRYHAKWKKRAFPLLALRSVGGIG